MSILSSLNNPRMPITFPVCKGCYEGRLLGGCGKSIKRCYYNDNLMTRVCLFVNVCFCGCVGVSVLLLCVCICDCVVCVCVCV